MQPVVEFDEVRHKYSVDGVEMKRSVTQLVSTFFSEFDSVRIAARMLAKDEFRTASKYEKYRSILHDVDPRSVEARDLIIKEWNRVRDEAAAEGTKMHKAIETYYTRGRECPDPMSQEFEMFRQFDSLTKRLGFLPFRSEQTVFDRDLSLAGSVDMIYIHRDDLMTYPTKVWVVDWKRSKEIRTESYSDAHGKWPFQSLPDCNFQHYSVQLNLYKYLLERNHGMQVERMTLVILHPNQIESRRSGEDRWSEIESRRSEYIMLDVADLQDQVKLALERR